MRKTDRQTMEYHIVQMEDLMKHFIEPAGPDGRWEIMDAIFGNLGIKVPRTIGPAGSTSRLPELYLENLQEVLKFARASLDHLEAGEPLTDVFRVIDVIMDEQ